jgi:hypothetical protein
MVAESFQVAFTKRQWTAYQFVLKFHRLQQRAPTAVELSRGLSISLADSSKLIGALTAKGVLERRVSHVLAIVPPDYLARAGFEAARPARSECLASPGRGMT